MAANFKLMSTTFEAGQPIPQRYTCEGAGDSPPLFWTDPPEETHSLALTVDDPDAPRKTFVHWVLFNLPPDWRELPEALNEAAFADEAPSEGPVQGVNDFGNLGYGPPCPPRGDAPHHYAFRLYALDVMLQGLGKGATRKQLTQAMVGHILAEADLVSRYQRAA